MTQILRPRRASIGEGTEVGRYLPTRSHTTVGAWCFLDLYGPSDVSDGPGMQVGPHPHVGLQTVTWLLSGEVVHRDSLGHHQVIRPGQLNVMTAGAGIAHAEESADRHPRWLHGLQLWVALPQALSQTAAAFQHLADLPVAEVGPARATVFVGELAGARSAATVHSPLLGAEITVVGAIPAELPVEREFEHAVVVVDGTVQVEGRSLPTGAGAYLPPGRHALAMAGEPSGRVVLLGGEPFTEPLVMWWNFVGSSADQIVSAREDWEADRRFGPVPGSQAPRVPAPALPPGRLVAR